jgi:Leucine-rich repeat (LRR) protein
MNQDKFNHTTSTLSGSLINTITQEDETLKDQTLTEDLVFKSAMTKDYKSI